MRRLFYLPCESEIKTAIGWESADSTIFLDSICYLEVINEDDCLVEGVCSFVELFSSPRRAVSKISGNYFFGKNRIRMSNRRALKNLTPSGRYYCRYNGIPVLFKEGTKNDCFTNVPLSLGLCDPICDNDNWTAKSYCLAVDTENRMFVQLRNKGEENGFWVEV